MADYKLKYQITADGKQAKTEIANVDKLINKIGGAGFGKLGVEAVALQRGVKGVASEVSNVVSALTGNRLSGAASQVTSLANAFGAIPGPVGIAVGLVTGLGVAAIGAGGALFELTKTAAEYGSVIHDASDKTGLHAETLSAMDLAAKQSGTTLETVTTAIAKFTKNVGAGKDELKAFGITPKQAIADLDGSLAKVFKRIADAKPGYEQITLAQKAFGRSGADLLPFIKQFNGDLPTLIKNAKALGLTLSDEDAKASDEFGDQLAELEQQAKTLGIAFARDLMPVFTSAMRDIESWLGRNKDTIRDWGDRTANIVSGLIAYWNDLTEAVKNYGVSQTEITTKSGNKYGWLSLVLGGAMGIAVAERGEQERRKAAPVEDYTTGKFRLNPVTNTIEKIPEQKAPPPAFPDFGEGGKDKFELSAKAKAIVAQANKLGISPLDLATFIGYETAGTFSTSITNQIGRFGLIQFGKQEAGQYGAYKGQPFDKQLDAVGKYLKDRFAKAGVELSGANLLQEYTAILAGSPTRPVTTQDKYNKGITPLSAVKQMLLGGGKGYTQADALKQFFGGKESNIPADRAGTEYARMQKEAIDRQNKANEETLATISKGLDDEVALRQSHAETMKTLLDKSAAQGVITEEDATNSKMKIEEEFLDFKLQKLKEEGTAVEGNFKEEARVAQETALLEDQIDQTRARNQAERYKAEKKRNEERNKSWSDYVKRIQEATEAEDAEQQRQYEEKRQIRLQHTIGSGQAPDAFSALREHFVEGGNTALIAGVDAVSGAFEQLGQAVGSAVEAFVLYGSAGTSVRQVTAQILASIAQQAAVQAIYELAQGLAVLALAFFGVPNAGPSAAAHFAAAATYGVIAGVTAGIGRAVAGNSFKQTGGSGGKGSPGSTGAYSYGGNSNANQNPTPISRASQNAFASSRQDPLMHAIDRNTAATVALHGKIAGMNPGDVLTAGAQQRKGFIGRQTVEDIRANSGIGTNLMRATGNR